MVKEICDNCIYQKDCKPNIIQYTQSHTDLGVTHTATVIKCLSYVPIRIPNIDREELRQMAIANHDIEKLVITLLRRNNGEKDSRAKTKRRR